MSNINARINWILFRSEEDYFSILSCSDEDEKFSVLGHIPNPIIGQEYAMKGTWTIHPHHGRQFEAETFTLIPPTSKEGIEKLLASGAIKGVGKTCAKRIADRFGEDSLDVIENTPEKLLEIRGIGKKSLEKIKSGWAESQEIVKIQEFLQQCGVSLSLAPKIYKYYSTDAIDVIKENPYILTEDLWGVGFRTADTIAKSLDIPNDDPNRLKAGVIYYLKRQSTSGHCYQRASVLIDECQRGLGVDRMTIGRLVHQMAKEKKDIREDDGAVYLGSYYAAEVGVARKLYEIDQFKGSLADVNIPKLEESFGIRYDATQIEAIQNAVKNKIAVITGGPGTGKTTIIKAIVKAFAEYKLDVVLASPTGRAAKRMSEVVGMEAKTIHRLLEYNTQEFTRNEENPIDGDVLILDECSMIDIMLMYSLLKAVPPHMNVVLVGDVDQLPSVGPGNVLSDIIESEMFYTARLEKVFRQAEESDIIVNAHRINKGLMPEFRDRDVTLIETRSINKTILEIIKMWDADDVQVLSPMKKTSTGTIELNNMLQDAINKNAVLHERKYIKYKIGDRVMQIRNNYDKEVFNGSLGKITGYEEDVMSVEFDDKIVEYDNSELDEIMLAYAITIHKSQGSEFPIVIVPLSLEHSRMLQRNLIYTAFTRPSERLYLIGDSKALERAIENDKTTARRTKLKDRIRSW